LYIHAVPGYAFEIISHMHGDIHHLSGKNLWSGNAVWLDILTNIRKVAVAISFYLL